MKEVWRDIEGYVGYYQISNYGNARSLNRQYINAIGVKYSRSGRTIKQQTSEGYKYIYLSKDGVSKKMYIHRLVAMAFLPNNDNKPEVNHIDCDKSNNHLDNLEWNTTSENARHAVSMGLRNTKRGKELPHSMPVIDLYTGIYYECIKDAWKSQDKYKRASSLNRLINEGKSDRYKLVDNEK